jgi:hypothetical protein
VSTLKYYRHARLARWLVPAIYAASAVVFAIDITSADILAFGPCYMPLVATALFHRDRRAVWVLAAIASAMVIVGAFVPSIDPDTLHLAVNRVLSLGAVLVAVVCVRYVRSVEEQMEERMGSASAEGSDAVVLERVREAP